MRPKYLTILEALEAGHSFTSADNVMVYGVKDDLGLMRVIVDQDGEMRNVTLNSFIFMCDAIPDEAIDKMEAALEGLTPR